MHLPQPLDPVTAAGRAMQCRRVLLETGPLQKALLASATLPVMVTDATGTVQLFNVGAERMLGYAAVDVVDKMKLSDMHDPREILLRAQAMSQEFDTVIAADFDALACRAMRGIDDCHESTLLGKSGERIPAAVSMTALRDDYHRIIGYLSIATDLSTRRRVELLVSRMTHEVRTPLSAILGFAQLLECGSPPPTASQQKSIERILLAGWDLVELMDETVDLDRTESGKLFVTMESLSLAQVMRDCEVAIERHADTHGVTVTFPVLESGDHVMADRRRVQQVLRTLLANAIRHSATGAAILVECDRRGSESIRIRIRRGHEEPSADQPACQRESAVDGKGIGLALTQRLVELMGGSIGADSADGTAGVHWFELNREERHDDKKHDDR
jgi:PAS domain S-box-containing protein